jgi:hypothetical protein
VAAGHSGSGASRLGSNHRWFAPREGSQAFTPFLSKEVFTHKSDGWTKGLVGVAGEFVGLPHFPTPLSPRRKRVLINREGAAGRWANFIATHTQGGDAKALALG